MTSSYAEDADAPEPSNEVGGDGQGGRAAAPEVDESEMPHPPPIPTEEPDTRPTAETDRDGMPDSPGVG